MHPCEGLVLLCAGASLTLSPVYSFGYHNEIKKLLESIQNIMEVKDLEMKLYEG